MTSECTEGSTVTSPGSTPIYIVNPYLNVSVERRRRMESLEDRTRSNLRNLVISHPGLETILRRTPPAYREFLIRIHTLLGVFEPGLWNSLSVGSS